MERELSAEEVNKIANLARLSLSSEDVAEYQKKLARVFAYVAELESLQLESKGFPQHVPADSVAMREDKATPYTNQARLLANAPQVEGTSFVLPVVLEESR